MKVSAILDKAYNTITKKDGDIKKSVLNFISKHNIELDTIVDEYGAIELAMDCPKRTQKDVLYFIKDYFQQNKKDVKQNNFKLIDLKTKSYKEVARTLHPDSPTGDTESFQFLQEIKEDLWNYKGENVKFRIERIGKIDWLEEKFLDDVNTQYADLFKTMQPIQINKFVDNLWKEYQQK